MGKAHIYNSDEYHSERARYESMSLSELYQAHIDLPANASEATVAAIITSINLIFESRVEAVRSDQAEFWEALRKDRLARLSQST